MGYSSKPFLPKLPLDHDGIAATEGSQGSFIGQGCNLDTLWSASHWQGSSGLSGAAAYAAVAFMVKAVASKSSPGLVFTGTVFPQPHSPFLSLAGRVCC